MPNGYEVSEYEVISRKSSGNATTFSGPLDPDDHEYLISDLARNTEYEICVTAKVELDEDIEDEEEKVCELVSTIPLVLVSSLVVLFCVLGYIGLMILVGYLCVEAAHEEDVGGTRGEGGRGREAEIKGTTSNVPRPTGRQPT